jgi:hypothetical protein
VTKITVLTLLLLFSGAPAVKAQDANAFRCVATVYRLRGERWKLIQSIDVRPSLQEEELTNRRIRLDGRRYLFASVFPTDESMHSAKGPDSLKIGVAMSSRRKTNAFDLPNNAVAEATLAAIDTLRVERTAHVGGRLRLMRFECWDSDLEKKS